MHVGSGRGNARDGARDGASTSAALGCCVSARIGHGGTFARAAAAAAAAAAVAHEKHEALRLKARPHVSLERLLKA